MEDYAMYLRKSRADIEMEALSKEDTLKRHRAILDELADRLHLCVTDVYTEVVSGETIADRPEIQKLLNNIYQKKYRGVLVVEVERLARGDTKDQGVIAEAFKYSNTLIVTPTKRYDPNNEFDEEYFEFGLFMSRREYKTINRRMQRGKLASVKEGNYIAAVRPYGYAIIRPEKKVRTLEIVPEEADIVRFIYAQFVNEHCNASTIARMLTRMGVVTYSGKREWYDNAVNEILHNPVYAGMIRWKYRPVKKEFDEFGNLQEIRSRQKPEDMILVKGRHDAIISMELFEAAQKRFADEPNRVPLKTALKNPFAGLVFCKKCGRAFFYHDAKKSSGTRIRMAHTNSQLCKVKSCFYDDFRDAVLDTLQAHMEDFKVKLEDDTEHAHIEQHENMIAATERNLKELSERRASLFDLLERGIYAESDFLERKHMLEQQKARLELELKQLLETRPEKIDYQEKIISFSDAIRAVKDDAMPVPAKNRLLKSIIQRIEFSRENDDAFILDIYLK